MEPRAFVEGLLLRYAAIAELWVGHDFRFGRDRSGDAAWLRAEGRERGFAVHEFPAVLDGDRPFSSTRIRAALAAGEIDEAARMLGHTVLMEGRVGRGRGQGAKLLVPTANLDLPAGAVSARPRGVRRLGGDPRAAWFPSVREHRGPSDPGG